MSKQLRGSAIVFDVYRTDARGRLNNAIGMFVGDDKQLPIKQELPESIAVLPMYDDDNQIWLDMLGIERGGI